LRSAYTPPKPAPIARACTHGVGSKRGAGGVISAGGGHVWGMGGTWVHPTHTQAHSMASSGQTLAQVSEGCH